jgi:hypothetical protein
LAHAASLASPDHHVAQQEADPALRLMQSGIMQQVLGILSAEGGSMKARRREGMGVAVRRPARTGASSALEETRANHIDTITNIIIFGLKYSIMGSLVDSIVLMTIHFHDWGMP